MPGPKGQERGLRSPFSLRAGMDIPQFKGMNVQDDPASMGDDQFQMLENIRLGGGAGIRPRPGLSKTNATSLAGCIIGVWDDRVPETGGGYVLLWTPFGVVVTS